MQVLYQRCAAVDVGKDVIAVAVRLPGDGLDGRQTVKRTFKAFYGVLKQAARWLTEQGVTHVAMEATGVYSMPVYHALVEHGRFERVLVCNTRHVQNVPGRKTDLSDAEWLAQLLECGLVRGSFIPPAEIKAARDVLRYRTKLVESHTSELQRLGNVLQDAGIKIDSVASSLTTKSARVMVEALIDGERRPGVLADLARGRMRAKIGDLAVAVEGRFDAHHALMCRLHLQHLDQLEAMITKLDGQVEEMMQPFRAQRDLLKSIPGIGELASAAVISEIGVELSDYFPTAQHLGSWTGLCPGNHESAGKRYRGHRRKGNQHLQPVLVECAWAAVRTDGYLREFYRRSVLKFGGWRSPAAKKKAIIAVAHKLAVIIWYVLATGRPYHDLGADYFAARLDPAIETRRLVAKLQALGHTVTLDPAA
ncbi:IS110 family transposase [Pseudonocardia nigra]|uniref:IS110 family transposase n=1 Tax=Pseudonocardia nigra TaxID=1921578 RepID=UPI001C603802|nr:IS110 family transposase [Pseudonocardia nigra]